MTTIQKPVATMDKRVRDALVDQLRACKTEEEIINFDKWFNSQANSGPLYEVICEFLRNRSISRGLAAKWLCTLMEDREKSIQ